MPPIPRQLADFRREGANRLVAAGEYDFYGAFSSWCRGFCRYLQLLHLFLDVATPSKDPLDPPCRHRNDPDGGQAHTAPNDYECRPPFHTKRY